MYKLIQIELVLFNLGIYFSQIKWTFFPKVNLIKNINEKGFEIIFYLINLIKIVGLQDLQGQIIF